ncbi:uncharacterized protein LOC144768926 [Lissotriton helveticus]
MNTITVYEHSNFRGLSKTFTSDVPNLAYENFNDCITSVKIVGQPWVLYQHIHYGGQCVVLEEGEHPGSTMNDAVSSLRLITEDLSNPMITVYEHINGGGKALVLTAESNLAFGIMHDNISSHRVQSGAWALYEHINRGGRCIVARAGEYLANYGSIGFNDQVSHVYPLRAGKSSVTATILWDQKRVENERNYEIEPFYYKNQTNIEQEFTASTSREFEKCVSHSFEFSNATTLTVGASFTLKGVVDINTELSNTFTVTKGQTDSSTTRKNSKLETKVKAPPRSNVTVHFMSREVTIVVPVELKIVQGGTTRTEIGTYRCKSGTETYIDVQSIPIGFKRASYRGKVYRAMITNIEQEIALFDQRIGSGTGTNEEKKQRKQLKEKLENILQERVAKRWAASKLSNFEYGESSGKVLAWKIKSDQAKNHIKLISVEGETNGRTSTIDIGEAFLDFFQQIYKEEISDDPVTRLSWLEEIILPTLTPEQSDRLDSPISEIEVSEAIKNVKRGKAAGPTVFLIQPYLPAAQCKSQQESSGSHLSNLQTILWRAFMAIYTSLNTIQPYLPAAQCKSQQESSGSHLSNLQTILWRDPAIFASSTVVKEGNKFEILQLTTMNSITVYEHAYFKGNHKTFTSDVPNLVKENFNDCITSVKIVGQPWILYDKKYYEGECVVLEEGEHPGSTMNDRTSSLQLVTDDLSNPQITVYEHIHRGGKSLVLTQESNLAFGGMHDNISSHSVQRGAWALYEHVNRGGRCFVARAGETLENYGTIGFNDQVSHVYPLRAGRSTVYTSPAFKKEILNLTIATSGLSASALKRKSMQSSMIDFLPSLKRQRVTVESCPVQPTSDEASKTQQESAKDSSPLKRLQRVPEKETVKIPTAGTLNSAPRHSIKDTVSASLLNSRSMVKHAVDIFELLSDVNLDILFITETWFNSSCTPVVEFAIPRGDKIMGADRAMGRGGGVVVVFRDTWSFTSESSSKLGDGEFLHFSLALTPHFTLGRTLIYRPPGPCGFFLKALEEVIVPRALRFSKFLLLGDFNIHVDMKELSDALSLLETFSLAQLIQWLKLPTHSGGHLLDLICSNFALTISDPLTLSWSDHKLIRFSWPTCHQKINVSALSNVLQQSRPVLSPGLTAAVQQFATWISSGVQASAKQGSGLNKRTTPSKPWFSQALKALKLDCKKLERYLLTPTNEPHSNKTALHLSEKPATSNKTGPGEQKQLPPYQPPGETLDAQYSQSGVGSTLWLPLPEKEEGKRLLLQSKSHAIVPGGITARVKEEHTFEILKLTTMNTITVYEHANFQGIYKTFTSDVPNLVNENFNDCISSVKIVGQPWVLYEHLHYQGQAVPLEEGEYAQVSMNDGASSLRLITDDLSNPQITVYEHINGGGKALVLTAESNLAFGGMHDNISSHRVQSGAWALYEHINRGGRCIIARAGEYLANYCTIGFNDQVSHVYPLRGGKSSVTATILWDKKRVESERNVQIDQYHYKNQSSVEQQFTATSSKEFEKFVSHSFEFSNSTTLTVGTSFTLKGVVDINTELSNTFTVKKGQTESSTMKKKTELTMPVKAPPRSNVTVSFMCKEVTIAVPVELKIVQGGTTRIETGTYRCESGTETTIDVQSLPVA